MDFIANYKGASPSISGDGYTVAHIELTTSGVFLKVYEGGLHVDSFGLQAGGYPSNGGSSIDVSYDGSVIVVGLAGQPLQVINRSGSLGSLYTFQTFFYGYGSVAISDDGTVIAMSHPSDDTRSMRGGVVRVYKATNTGTDTNWQLLPGSSAIFGLWIDDAIGATNDSRRGSLVVAKTSTDDIYVALVGRYDTTSGSYSGSCRVYKYDVSQTTADTFVNKFVGWSPVGAALASPFGTYDTQSSGKIFMDFVVSSIDDTLMLAIGRGIDGPVQVYRYNDCSGNLGTWVQIGADISTAPIDYTRSPGATNCKLSADGTKLTIGFQSVVDELEGVCYSARSVLYQLDTTSDVANVATLQWDERKTTSFTTSESECILDADTVDLSSDGQTLIIGSDITGIEIYDVTSCLSTDGTPITSIPGGCPCDDKCVLKALYDATAGDGWTYKENWNVDDPASDPCSSSQPWHGIECTDGKVSAISLGELAVYLLSLWVPFLRAVVSYLLVHVVHKNQF